MNEKKRYISSFSFAYYSVLMFVFINMSHQTAGNRIRITIDGEVYGTYSLEDDQTIEIKEDLGINTVSKRW